MFNTIKQKLLKQKKVTSYLKYAFGEIVLIVIGILIAFSLNNWNEERQSTKVRNGIYRDIANDLKSDTTEARRILNYYKKNEPIFTRVMNDTLSSQEMADCDACLNIMIVEKLFSLNTRGFSQLSAYRNTKIKKNDSLTFNISNFYSKASEYIEKLNEVLHSDIIEYIKNMNDNYPWFGKVIRTGKINREGIKFLAESQEYKTKVTYRYLMIYNNYVLNLEKFLVQSKAILNQINDRLENK